METFEARYCAAHRCTVAQFRRRVFWRCLHRRAFPLAPFLLVLNRSYFAPDLDFVIRVGECHEMGKVWAETRRYFTDPQHQRWLRRKADVRISAHKVINLATQYLPAGSTPAEATELY
jgi:hypothetical protein